MTISTVISICSLCFGSGILSAIFSRLFKRMKAQDLGIQALLRDRLVQSFKEYSAKGYADISDRENFENLYKQYHALGANGVMDDVYKKFMNLPFTGGGQK